MFLLLLLPTASPLGLGVLAKKAKTAEALKLRELGDDHPVTQRYNEAQASEATEAPTEILRRLRGRSLGVIAEYGKDTPDLASVCGELREAGASALALNMHRCTVEDVELAVREETRAKNDYPGPMPVLWMDLVVDEIQLAQAASLGATAVTLQMDFGLESCRELMSKCPAYGLEPLLVCKAGVTPLEDIVTTAIELDPPIIVVSASLDEARRVREKIPGCAVARIEAYPDQSLVEAEDAWRLRDAGYDGVWLSDVLYKFGSFSGTLFAAAPDSITTVIKATKSKASAQFAVASGTFGGQGEGAKEYLGDILM